MATTKNGLRARISDIFAPPLRLFCGVLLLTAVISPAVALGAAPPLAERFPALAQLPHDPAQSVNLEAGLVVDDLRTLLKRYESYVALMGETEVGRRFFQGPAQVAAFGVDIMGELEGIAQLASPAGGPVPMGLGVYSFPGGVMPQMVVKVDAGFIGRVEKAFAGTEPPAWPGSVSEGKLRITIEQFQLVGVEGDDGWLRVGMAEDALKPGFKETLFAAEARSWLQDADGFFFVRGGGFVSQMLGAANSDPMVAQLLGSFRSAAIAWGHDGDKTSLMRMFVDMPALAQYGPMVRRTDLTNHLSQVWNGDATGLLSLSLPPALLQAAAAFQSKLTDNPELQVPPELIETLGKLDGRIGIAGFGSPGDMSLGIGFQDETSANQAVVAVRHWLSSLNESEESAGGREYIKESIATGGEAFHVLPAPGLQGMRVAAMGKSMVVVLQRARLAKLAAHAAEGTDKGADRLLVTKAMKKVLERPAIVLGYLLMSGDGAMFELFGALASYGAEFMKAQNPVLGNMGFVQKYLEQLPTLIALQTFYWSMTYDMAVWMDLDRSVLVLQVSSSEI